MLKKRIVPCLDIKDGRTVKGVQFESLKDAGNPVTLAKRYAESGADELVLLDISATLSGKKTMLSVVRAVAENIAIPFTVGGGIHSLFDVQAVIEAGADKVSINSAALKNPNLITQIANVYGSQCVVLAVDTRYNNTNWQVYSHGGTQCTNWSTLEWVQHAENLGVGELLLTAMNNDGTHQGFALDLLSTITDAINIPVIASGGAGTIQHFLNVFQKTKVTAALAASVFHYNTIAIPHLKKYLFDNNIPVRL
jgi:cyclase